VKSITLRIDDDLYERSRVLAAPRKTTVTGLVREHLRSLSDAEARREIQAMIGRFGGKVGRMPSREERHARR
jgi:predicted transcriptional regulator